MQSTDDVAGEFLAESRKECAAYWDQLGPLTAAQKRRKAHELAWRKNLAAAGAMPTPELIADIRSGEKDRRDHQSMQNLLRSRARLAQWRRDGYSFDAEHRLVAPQRPNSNGPRPTRPRESRSRRSETRSPAGSSSARGPDRPPPSSDDDPPRSRPTIPCAECGRPCTPQRSTLSYCQDSSRCRVAALRRRRKQATDLEQAALLIRAEWAHRLVDTGELDGEDALLLVVTPAPEVHKRSIKAATVGVAA